VWACVLEVAKVAKVANVFVVVGRMRPKRFQVVGAGAARLAVMGVL
jgi:hypothetical protein